MQWATNANQWLDALSSADPTPGGGAAAAVSGAMGCSLLLMALRTTLKRKTTPAQYRPALERHVQQAEELLSQLKALAAQDAQAYQNYLASAKLPKEDPARKQAVQDALWQAALVPAETVHTCQAGLALLESAAPLIDKIILSDMACARHLLQAALACCVENIRANAAYITQPERTEQIQHILRSLA